MLASASSSCSLLVPSGDVVLNRRPLSVIRPPSWVSREQISDRVFTGKRKEQLQKYLEKMRAQAIIEWKNADVKKAYDQGLAQPHATTGS